MPDLAVNSVSFHPTAQVQQTQPAQPPKASSDHKPPASAGSSHGPAVVLGGALQGASNSSSSGSGGNSNGGGSQSGGQQATGQRINHVI